MVPGRPVRMGLMKTAGASVRACSKEEGQEQANKNAGCGGMRTSAMRHVLIVHMLCDRDVG